MNFSPKYIVAFTLIFIFAMRIGIPVLTGNKIVQKAFIEQQEEKSSEDKAVEKSMNHSIEADVIHFPQASDLNLNTTEHCLAKTNSFLPMQYFAIPTPPPWFKS